MIAHGPDEVGVGELVLDCRMLAVVTPLVENHGVVHGCVENPKPQRLPPFFALPRHGVDPPHHILQVGATHLLVVLSADLGGVAFCKLNWSAPRDAAWLTGGSLRCECAGDAFALLAASEFAKHDACRAYARCGDVAEPDAVRCDLVLAFRAWQDLDPAREFRCFVLDGRLVAACQRKIDAAFDDLAAAAADELGEDDDGDRVLDGVRRKIAALLDSGLDLPRHCVVDVAVQGARATLVDVNVASEDTDPLLFTWPELLDLRATTVAAPRPSSSAFELRVVDADSPAVQPSELSSFRAPLDVAAIAEAGGLDELLAAMQQQQRLDGDSSSEDDDEQASN